MWTVRIFQRSVWVAARMLSTRMLSEQSADTNTRPEQYGSLCDLSVSAWRSAVVFHWWTTSLRLHHWDYNQIILEVYPWSTHNAFSACTWLNQTSTITWPKHTICLTGMSKHLLATAISWAHNRTTLLNSRQGFRANPSFDPVKFQLNSDSRKDFNSISLILLKIFNAFV